MTQAEDYVMVKYVNIDGSTFVHLNSKYAKPFTIHVDIWDNLLTLQEHESVQTANTLFDRINAHVQSVDSPIHLREDSLDSEPKGLVN